MLQANTSGSVSPSTSRTSSPIPGWKSFKKSGSATPKKGKAKTAISGSSTPVRALDQRHIDIMGLNLYSKDEGSDVAEVTPKMSFGRENLLEEVRKTLDLQENDKHSVSLVVIGECRRQAYPLIE